MKTKNLWYTAFAVASAFVANAPSSATAAPVHMWTFDTDFNDSVGTAHGTAIGGPNGSVTITSTPGEFLVGAGGLRIAHHNSDTVNYVDIDTSMSSTRVFPATNPMAFSVNLFYRFDPSIGQDDSRNFLFETSPNFSIGLGQNAPPANDMEWFFQGSPTLQDTDGPNTNDGNWHQATLVWDKAGSETVSFYHDGVLLDRVNIPAAFDFNQAGQASGLHIGTFRSANDRNWVGYIDEFAIHHAAITASDVSALYVDAFGEQPRIIPAMELSAPVGANVSYNFLGGWERATYSDVPGAGNDLGDGGFSGASYARTLGAGDNTIEITLTDLPEHDFASIGMILAQLDSIDPVRDGDRFILLLDGVEIFNEGFGFGVSGANNDPVYADPEGIATLTDTNLFGDVLFNDNMYDLGAYSGLQNISHTSSTLTLTIIGRHNQASGEFYGIDKVSIQVGVVPEPASIWMIAGLAFGFILCKRKYN